MKKSHRIVLSAIGFAAATLVLVVPILVYVYTFGPELSREHSRWAEMGSAMSGIYGPVLTILTLWVLWRQFKLQEITTQHMLDQTWIQSSKSDAEFYLSRVEQALTAISPEGLSARITLMTNFSRPDISLDDLHSEELRRVCLVLRTEFPDLHTSWAGLYGPIMGNLTDKRFEPQVIAIRQKAIVMFTYATCAALDNLVHCAMSEHVAFKYQFSPALIRATEAIPSQT